MSATADPFDNSESRYNPSLTYEERSRIRRQRRESLLQEEKEESSPEPGGSRSRASSCSSQGTPSYYRTHFSPSPPSPTPPAWTLYLSNQNCNSHSKGTTSLKERSVLVKQVSSSGATKVGRSDALSTARANSHSDLTTLDGHSNRPCRLSLAGGEQVSATASARPCSPLTPSPAVERASHFLSGVIARQQSRERSASPLLDQPDKEKWNSYLITPCSSRHAQQQVMERCSSPLATTSWCQSPIFGAEGEKFRFDRSAVLAGTNSTKSMVKESNNVDQSKAASSTASQAVPIKNQNGKHKISSSFTTSEIESALNSFESILSSDSLLVPSDMPESAEEAHSSLSPRSSLSSRSGFSFDQPFIPAAPNGTAMHRPSTFASGLTFVDADIQPSLDVWPLMQEPSAIRGQIQKTNVVYGSHEDSSVTVIPSSGFFDSSQSQADMSDKSALDYDASSGSGSGMEKKKDRSSGKKNREIKNTRSNALALGHSKSRHVSANIVSERGEEEVDAAIGKQVTANSSPRQGVKKGKDKETRARRLFGGKRDEGDFQFGQSASVTDVHSLTSAAPSGDLERNPKFSMSNFRKSKKISYTFSDDMGGKTGTLDVGGLSKLSMPNLSRPSPPLDLQHRDVTPESSDSSSSPSHVKKKPSFAHRIINLVGGVNKEGAEKLANPVLLKNYKQFDVGLPGPANETSSDFSRSGSNVDIAILSHERPSASSSETGMRRSQSTLSCYVQGNDSKLDSTESGMTPTHKKKSSNSYSLVSSSSRKGVIDPTDMKPSGSRASTKSANSPAKQRSMVPSHPTSDSSVRGSNVCGKITPSSSPSSARKLEATSSPTKGSVSGKLSPRTSPLASKKVVTGNSKLSSNSKGTHAFSTEAAKSNNHGNFPTSRDRDKDSPKHSALKTSPSKHSILTTSKTSSTTSLTRTNSSVGRASPKTSPDSGKKKTIPSKRRESPTSSPIMARKPLQHGVSSPKASPLLKRKVVQSTGRSGVKLSPTKIVVTVSSVARSSPKVTSPLSSKKITPAPPRLSKVNLDTDSEVEPSNQPSSFMRFSSARKPIIIRSPNRSKNSSPVLKKHLTRADANRPSMSESSSVSSLDSASPHKRRETSASRDSAAVPSETLLDNLGWGTASSDVVTESALKLDIDSLLASVEDKLSSLVPSEPLFNNETMTADVPEELKSSRGINDLCSPPSRRSASLDDGSQDATACKDPTPLIKGLKGDKRSAGLVIVTSSVKVSANSGKKDISSVKAKMSGKVVSLLANKMSVVKKTPTSSSGTSGISLSSKTFTAARPPRPPVSKEPALPKPAPLVNSKSRTSSTGQPRPQVMVARGAAQPGAMQKKLLSKSGSSPSFELPKEVELDDSLRSRSGSDLIGNKKPESFPKRTSSLNKSMKLKHPSRIRPGSAKAVSVQQHQESVRTPVRSSAGQSTRRSLRGAQNRDILGSKVSDSTTFSKDKAVSAASLTSGGSENVSTTKLKSTTVQRSDGVGERGREGSNSKIIHSSPTLSAKVPLKSSVAMQRGGNLRKSGKMGSGSIPPATGGDSSFSPSRGSMKRKSLRGSQRRKESVGESSSPQASSSSFSSPSRVSTLKRTGSKGAKRKDSTGERRNSKAGDASISTASVADPSASKGSRGTIKMDQEGEILDAFDQISSKATMLVSSDHRRAVRPKARQKASVSHLKILSSREGVTSDLIAHEEEARMVDPNAYATYMAKKKLAPSAMAGLAARVDFSTVKLRKTGTLQQESSDNAGCIINTQSGVPTVTPGTEFNTIHPTMLLLIKGRRNVQTRLVEPSGSSLNSGDAFLLVNKTNLFHWVGKDANIIEKARASDVAMRILHKKELSCRADAATVLKEEESNRNAKRDDKFWGLIGGRKDVKSSESAPGDEVYEKAVHFATTVYRLEEEDKESVHFVPIHENSSKVMSIGLLQREHIFLFDFYSEVYVWIGNHSSIPVRKKAMALGKKHFDSDCKPPIFSIRNSPSHGSNRYRPRSSTRSSRHQATNSSGRKNSRGSKTDLSPRPSWALFARMNEGSEHILFREKFCDWPEAGRIIKMKGHASSGEAQEKAPQEELQPADVEKMLKDVIPFDGLRLEGDNIYRGQGNFKISNSSFSRNRTRTIEVKKWVIKEFDNVMVPTSSQDLFYSSESYIIRWYFQLMVVRELEGLCPGLGIFARDRAYKKSQQEATEGETPPTKARAAAAELDSDSSLEEDECEEKKMLESGGRDRYAYFFWQGANCTVNEKGASALMTVELDKEKGPQIRVVQGKEPAAFYNLFNGGMIILNGKSETDSLQSKSKEIRMFCVRTQVKAEACLVELMPEEHKPIGADLRSRGCYVVYHVTVGKLYLWVGSKCTKSLKKTGTCAAKWLKKRLHGVELIQANEGKEPNDLWNLLGSKESYLSLLNDLRKFDYTPRLFEFTSSVGDFKAQEVVFPARNDELEAFPFDQSDLYSATQPAIFLMDAWTELYVWLGWWPEEKNNLLREANAITGSSHTRWLRDKKLAMETTQHYAKACKRIRTPKTYVIHAGMEHERFKNLFPYWEDIQEPNCNGKTHPKILDLEGELQKYTRTQFTLEELKQKPPPEGVDESKLEVYLSDEDFERLLKVNRSEFNKMPLWKQTNQKKAVGLF